MSLESLKIYSMAMELGEKVWNIVDRWKFFEKDTIGKQLVRAVDSVAANISEGYGRYHFKENRNFSYYSRGSLYETKTWLIKAHDRKLISTDEFQRLTSSIEILGKMLNTYIRSIGQVSEPLEEYGDSSEADTNDQ